LMDKEILQS